MGKVVDTGEYWEAREFELVSHALCQIDILNELIDASSSDHEDLWLLFDTRAAALKLIDYYEPEGEPEGGYKDNVISFRKRKAIKK